MRRILPLLVLLLAACGPTGTGPEAVCEREANDDPAVKLLIVRNLGNPGSSYNYQSDLANAHARAKRACLRRLGQLPPGGGVEQVRQPTSSFSGM